ncbi:hypothetical protein BKA69DRAFT_1126342 [Paraphysoderma sedebokerense]|nr:hypothetical protein BKA69DRAFT_1126342 [Paraphysoderma sedebokerense]
MLSAYTYNPTHVLFNLSTRASLSLATPLILSLFAERVKYSGLVVSIYSSNPELTPPPRDSFPSPPTSPFRESRKDMQRTTESTFSELQDLGVTFYSRVTKEFLKNVNFVVLFDHASEGLQESRDFLKDVAEVQDTGIIVLQAMERSESDVSRVLQNYHIQTWTIVRYGVIAEELFDFATPHTTVYPISTLDIGYFLSTLIESPRLVLHVGKTYTITGSVPVILPSSTKAKAKSEFGRSTDSVNALSSSDSTDFFKVCGINPRLVGVDPAHRQCKSGDALAFFLKVK